MQPKEAVDRIAKMLKSIGHKLELFNGYFEEATEVDELNGTTVDILVELMTFYNDVIKFFGDNLFGQLMYTHDLSSRTQSFGGDVIAIHDEDFWRPLTQQYDTFLQDVSNDFERINKLAQMGRTRSRYGEVEKLQSLLSLTSGSFEEQARLPCVMLPFDNRHGYFEQIEDFLSSGAAGIRSIALYGVGGVGQKYHGS